MSSKKEVHRSVQNMPNSTKSLPGNWRLSILVPTAQKSANFLGMGWALTNSIVVAYLITCATHCFCNNVDIFSSVSWTLRTFAWIIYPCTYLHKNKILVDWLKNLQEHQLSYDDHVRLDWLHTGIWLVILITKKSTI